MRQLRWIAIYSRQFLAPPNTRLPKSQYASTAATRHLFWRQSFVVTEFMSANVNNYCLDCRMQNQLHCMKSLTECHKYYAHAHALCCALKHDSLLRYNITYLTCGRSHFYVMTFTFDLMTFSVCSASAVMWFASEFTGVILHAGLISDPLGNLQPSPTPNGEI